VGGLIGREGRPAVAGETETLAVEVAGSGPASVMVLVDHLPIESLFGKVGELIGKLGELLEEGF
jgi:hypothetical protein